MLRGNKRTKCSRTSRKRQKFKTMRTWEICRKNTVAVVLIVLMNNKQMKKTWVFIKWNNSNSGFPPILEASIYRLPSYYIPMNDSRQKLVLHLSVLQQIYLSLLFLARIGLRRLPYSSQSNWYSSPFQDPSCSWKNPAYSLHRKSLHKRNIWLFKSSFEWCSCC